MSNLDKQTIGIIHEGHFYEILINKEPITFKEDIYPQVARDPMPLTFSDEDEKKLILVSYKATGEGHEPSIRDKSNQLPENSIEMLLKNSVDSSSSFSPSIVGGSVNLPHDTK
ncbi:hypothetical protein COJ00_27185 [Priestia megaterium]|uniref:hypothetical protein n=1 Tax=Priestia megaterium TaxID=1404 RepID=UPI000BF691CA|nr:hypothetical protein [Priestia megaterium]PFJ40216.1 hypothetical protein COJ00_27185 [Priestia megaterium]